MTRPNPWDLSSAHESALRELMRSPLDEEPRRARAARPGRRLSLLLFLAAAAAGAGLTVAGAALLGGEETSATTVAATTTAAPLPAGPALPAGYYPVGEGFGARVERVLVRPDAVLVSLTLAVDEEHDPADTAGHQGGRWLLEFPDGSSVRSSTVVFDPVARAAATIVFPAFDQDPAAATLRLLSAQELHTASFSATVPGTVAALPPAGTLELTLQPAAFALDGDGTMRLGTLFLAADGGRLDWTVEGDGITAHLSPGVALEGPNGTVILIPEDPFFDFRNRVLSDPPPALAAAGRVNLRPVDLTNLDPGADFTVTVALQVIWATPLVADAALPLQGATIVEVGAA
jgi:hypothetical protein